MKEIKIHRAIDRRMYNGCPSDDLAIELKSIKDARDYLKEHNINITYFPNGCFYVGFYIQEGHAPKIITDDCKSIETCVNACIKYMEESM